MTTTDSMMPPNKTKSEELQSFAAQKPVDCFTASEMYVRQILARIRKDKDSEPNDETYLF